MHTNSQYEPIRAKKIRLSKHAKHRCAQRAIDAGALNLVVSFGNREYDNRGGVRYTMTGDAMTRMTRALGSTAQMERLRDTYVVVDAETQTSVITAGHLH